MAESGKAVFLSYAREDAEATRRIADALRAFGVEVWFDQNELRGGDAWDTKIKTQIRECALFVPVISERTQARAEGYFRREWRQAVERTHDMAHGHAFIIPVVVDATPESEALVPEEFMRVHWTRLLNGVPTPEFVAQVKRLLEEPRRAVRSTAAAAADPGLASTRLGTRTAPPPVQAPWPNTAKESRKSPTLWTAVIAGIVAIAATSYFALRSPAVAYPPSMPASAPGAPEQARAAANAFTSADNKSIAVLPFANFSTDKNNEFFADGLHDEVITALAKIHDLKVISRTSVMSYKSTEDRNLRKIAADLGVVHILEGSVQRAGNKVHLNVQLIDARTDEHVWADSYTRDVTDIFSAESELAVAVTNALKSTLSPDEKSLIDRRPTNNQEAYDSYLRALVLNDELSYASTRADCEHVVELYRRATNLDPSFLLAHVESALLQGEMYFLATIDPTPERRASAQREVEAAERLAPDAPETHLARGAFEYTCNFDYAAALAEYQKAEARLPNNAQLLYRIGLAERRLGRFHDAMAHFRQAADLDPNHSNTVLALIEMAYALRHYAEVVQLCDHYAPRLAHSDNATVFKIRAHFELDHDRSKYLRDTAALPPEPIDPTGMEAAYLQAMRTNDYAAAQRALANPELTSINEGGGMFDAPVALHRALVAWLQGDTEKARRFATEAIAALRACTPTPRQRRWVAMDIALAEAMTGQTDAALREGKHAAEEEEARDKYSAGDINLTYGELLVIAGRKSEALNVLRGLMGTALVEGVNELRDDPVWSRLKDDPRFEDILKTAKPL